MSTSESHDCPGSCGERGVPPAAESSDDPARPPLHWVISIMARACRGDDQVWLWLGAVWPACSSVNWSYQWCEAGLVPLIDDSIPARSFAPDPRPPRQPAGA